MTRRAEALGGECIKLTDRLGRPDRVLVFPDRPAVFIEVKTPTGRVSPIQQYEARRLERIGFRSYVVRSDRDVDALLAEVRGA